MNMDGLTEVLSQKHGLSEALSARILKTVLNTIRSELKQSRSVKLKNFGTFIARKTHGKLRAKFDDSENFFK